MALIGHSHVAATSANRELTMVFIWRMFCKEFRGIRRVKCLLADVYQFSWQFAL